MRLYVLRNDFEVITSREDCLQQNLSGDSGFEIFGYADTEKELETMINHALGQGLCPDGV